MYGNYKLYLEIYYSFDEMKTYNNNNNITINIFINTMVKIKGKPEERLGK